MAFIINCCKNCVPPKRHRACHDTCKEYKDEKEQIAEGKVALAKSLGPDINVFEFNEIDYANCKGHKRRKRRR